MSQPEVKDLMDIKEASKWASDYTGKPVSEHNISYLIQYGRIHKYHSNGKIFVHKNELKKYYDKLIRQEENWKKSLGNDLNWHLSFAEFRESERTKHVHRLHPYKGKFIPQLVEYFLDSHTDEFKKQVYFQPGDIILDPFCGSGTTLVQANELGMHAVGIDISYFNSLIANIKIKKHDIKELERAIGRLTYELQVFQHKRKNVVFENRINEALSRFNNQYFPVPEFKQKVRKKILDEWAYGKEKLMLFKPVFDKLVDEHGIQIKQEKDEKFLDKWYLAPVREELDFMVEKINQIENPAVREVLQVILSRTARSTRATTHADLGTLKEPVYGPYYCKKHAKICKPLFTISNWWKRYSRDTVKRLKEFDKLRTETYQICLEGDSRTIDIMETTKRKHPALASLMERQKIAGIFSSPPYVGLIDYHEQHAYAYEIFGFERKDEAEIGPLFRGQGKEARQSYVEGIAKVLQNAKKFMKKDYDVFLVANDKYGLYPEIAEKAGMKIVNRFKRPVLNRVEKDRSPYAEIIFHLKDKNTLP